MKKEINKAMHEGHRIRLRNSVEKDPELESFSDYEVLEYLLSFFIPRKDTNPIAHELIENFGSFYGVLTANPDELYQISNMTQSAALFLPNLLSVVRRAEISRVKRSYCIETISDCVQAFRPYFIGRNHELLYLMMLDLNDRIISIDCLSQGVANFTGVDIGTIAAKTSRSQACKIAIAHNHPGGNLQPSNEDIHVTSAISHLMNSMGKELVDHLIFSGSEYFSFFENGLMTGLIEKADRVFGINRSKEVQAGLFVGRYVQEKNKKTATDGAPKDQTSEAEKSRSEKTEN